jgi:predicted PurR-regulated permease PerM
MTADAMRKMWVAALFVAVLAGLWFAREVFILLFASVLIALIFTSLTNLVRRALRLGRKMSLLAAGLLVCGALVGVGFWVVPSIADEFADLAERLPKAFSEARAKVESSPSFQKLQSIAPAMKDLIPKGSGSNVAKFFSSGFEAVSSVVFIVFAAIFIAGAPQMYRRMLVVMFPPRLRDDVNQTIDRVIRTLKFWLLGQLISMVAVGVLTGTALAIAGIPFAAELGLLAGLAEFIPFVGPVLVSIPALLMGFSQGTNKFLLVLVMVPAIQFVEGNILQPIVQRKAIELPPVVMLASMAILGAAFGLLGLFVAAPLVACVLVLIEEWYLKRVLHTHDRLLERKTVVTLKEKTATEKSPLL